MIVRDVRSALRSRGAATVSQLVADLGADRPLVESALAFWTHRGNVAVCESTLRACGTSCRRCPIGAGGPPAGPPPVVYEWVEQAG